MIEEDEYGEYEDEETLYEISCTKCNDTGVIVKECESCGGLGEISNKQCRICKGSGEIEVKCGCFGVIDDIKRRIRKL